jgi:hypothetical protein
VVRRFLDGQLTANLTTYLQALHAAGQANQQHTTLLLNCYTKLKDVARLNAFVSDGTDTGDADGNIEGGGNNNNNNNNNNGGGGGGGGGGGARFDVQTATRVCALAGYRDQVGVITSNYHSLMRNHFRRRCQIIVRNHVKLSLFVPISLRFPLTSPGRCDHARFCPVNHHLPMPSNTHSLTHSSFSFFLILSNLIRRSIWRTNTAKVTRT